MQPKTPGAWSDLGNAQFRAFADAAPDAIVTGNAQGEIAYANPAAQRLFGHPPERMVGRSITMLMPDRFKAAHRSGYTQYVATGRGTLVGQTIEVVGQRADGHVFPMELSLGSAGDGPSRTLTAVIRDLTERKRHERHLAAQLAVTSVLAAGLATDEAIARIVEDLTRALGWDVGVLWLRADHDPEGLRLRHTWQADPAATGAFAEATQHLALDLAGSTPAAVLEDAMPRWLDDLSPSVGFTRFAEAASAGLRSGVWLPLLAEGRAIGVVECLTREPLAIDEELRDLLMTVASQIGEYLGRRGTEQRLADEQRRFAAELARSNDELERFAQVAAHDLRTPLRTISGFAELVLRDVPELPAPAQEHLRLVIDSADAGGELLESLLTVARAGATLRPLEPTAPAAVLTSVLTALRAEIDARSARVRVEAVPPVLADPVQLGQLWQNLVANALRYTPADRAPVVTITGRRDGEVVELTVRDEGVGIDPAEADDLFTMFRRGRSSHLGAGAGIGLALCAKIVQRHGGRIWAEPADGGGAAFRFTLPAA